MPTMPAALRAILNSCGTSITKSYAFIRFFRNQWLALVMLIAKISTVEPA